MWGSLTLKYTDGSDAEFDTSASTSQDWTFWIGLFLVVLVMIGRDRFFKPWTWFRKGGGA